MGFIIKFLIVDPSVLHVAYHKVTKSSFFIPSENIYNMMSTFIVFNNVQKSYEFAKCYKQSLKRPSKRKGRFSINCFSK